MIRLFFTLLFLTFINASVFSQAVNKTNEGFALLLQFTYGYEFPGADLFTLYGANSRVGGGFEFMTKKHNLIFGADLGLMFGNTVKEDVLASLRTPNGGIIGNNKAYADILLKQRGLQASILAGKLFGLPIVDNPRSGIRVTVALGLLQHKVRIQESFEAEVPQIEGEYSKGYDKLSNGLMVQEFIGYQHLGQNRLINFYAGVQLTQGFTQNRRDWDYSAMRKLDEDRRDLLFGFKVGWTLPFYFGQKPEEILY